MTVTGLTRDDALAADSDDPLLKHRAGYRLPDGVIYLDGNSLGALPIHAPARVATAVEQQWGERLIASWNAVDAAADSDGWIDLPTRIGDKIGRIIGAAPGQVVVTDSTSVNVFKALAMALELRPDRRVILTQGGDFPTDGYVADGLARLLGRDHRVRRLTPSALQDAPSADVIQAIDSNTAVVLLSHVNYRTGAAHDLAAVTAAAHAAGALVVWDLAHSAGVMPVDFDAIDADFAVGCGYKYLNGGPGASAFLAIARRLQDQVSSPIAGWFGHARPFAFEAGFEPAADINLGQVGTPPVLSMVALEAGVDAVLAADPDAVRTKSVALTQRAIALADARLADYGVTVASPRDASMRGSQVCFRHPQAWPVNRALIDEGVIGDFRTPDILRLGFAPLYTRHVDVHDAMDTLADILRTRRWDAAVYHARTTVT